MATVQGPVQPYYRDAEAAVDEQAILDKYNAATIAQYNVQREQNRQNENKFYNQMYNTQRTAMDTIRQSNAAAVATGASRGVQAANELSAILGLQQESVESATELAQANRQTAQEETAAVLENVLAAYQQAQQERSQLISQGIEAASLGAQQQQANTAYLEYLRNLQVSDPNEYIRQAADYYNATNFASMSDEQFNQNLARADEQIAAAINTIPYAFAQSEPKDLQSVTNKYLRTTLETILTAHNLDASKETIDNYINEIVNDVSNVTFNNTIFNDNRSDMRRAAIAKATEKFNQAYTAKRAASQQTQKE